MINKINPAIWWNEGSLPADVQDVRNQVGVSPRQTWHPDRSVKPAKRQDFSGAPGLLQALVALPALAAQLTGEKKFREAGIVLYAYNQVIKNTWSITEAFAYLRENHIVG